MYIKTDSTPLVMYVFAATVYLWDIINNPQQKFNPDKIGTAFLALSIPGMLAYTLLAFGKLK
jgi:hypothetical protein